VTYSWRRGTSAVFGWPVASVWLDAIPAGWSYIRVHFRWGMAGDTNSVVDLTGTTANLISMGLVTTIGNGTETPPNARTAANDADPPTQRWLYLETRALRAHLVDPDNDLVLWEDSGSTEFTDTKGQVLATGLPAGDTLNLWFSWAAPVSWDPSGQAQIWCTWSILRKEP
jgi:hypothetical protein